MELVWLRIRGFRRFLDAEAQLHGRLTALVGPNEAGKSSILDALVHLNSTTAVDPRDISHGEDFPDTHPIFRARFWLSDDDRAAISHLHGGADARWYILEKRAGGALASAPEPALTTDLAPRQAALDTLERLRATRWAKVQSRAEDELGSRLDALGETLGVVVPFDEPSRELMKELAEAIGEATGQPKSADKLAAQLIDLADSDPPESPQVTARKILLERRPLFLKFDQQHRDLQSIYELDGMDLDSPPAALQNIARLAGLNLRQILKWVQQGDYASPSRPLEEANAALLKFFRESWTQSGVAVRLEHHETRLHVLISSPAGPYTSLSERSDGLRAFVALATFAEVHGAQSRDIVLLIDEAETHLHYNAQADLVRVLDTQQAASSVIYSTHSAGCLPEDLGSTVRVVVRENDQWSSVQNSFWTTGPGFDPLLIGMGASALVFGAVRRAVVAEGATDLILLPSLLREANDLQSLGYQVAPGVAEVSGQAIAELELQSAKAVYLVDDDQGGRDHASKLRAGGIDTERVLILGDGIEGGLGLEDLVKKPFYMSAVNRELELSGRPDRLKAVDIPTKGRAPAVRKWCEDRGYSEPRKVSVASTMALSARLERPVLSAIGKKALIDLHERIQKILGT